MLMLYFYIFNFINLHVITFFKCTLHATIYFIYNLVDMCFIRFPQDESKKLIWAKVMGLQVERLPKSPHLCSLHFSDDDFDRSSQTQIRLRENAIPIVNIVLYLNYIILFMLI